MPLLDIATTRLLLHNHRFNALSLVGGDQCIGCSTSSNFMSGNGIGKLYRLPNYDFGLRCLKMGRCRRIIKSVTMTSFETKGLVQERNFKERLCDSNSLQGIGLECVEVDKLSLMSSGESVELDEKEKLRRNRISKANKGNTPWNKGRKHSPETIIKIKERTRLAMQNPKVKMKLTILGHAQSQETKQKIGASVRIGWVRRRMKLKLQETCHFEWLNLIAETSRNGLLGEEELSWDSYKTLDEQLSQEWLQSIELRRKARKVKCDRRAPKSAEQKKRISQAISAKWNDPDYRDRVCSALAKYHGISEESERKPKRKVNSKRPTRSISPNSTDSDSPTSKNKSSTSPSRTRRSKGPMYKDPLVSCKLEMIKNIRAQRVTSGARKSKAIEQARVLIAEAEKAANALEVAAMTNPIAKASLAEARELIKEAFKSIEFINIKPPQSTADPKYPSEKSNKPRNDVELETNSRNKQKNRTDQTPSLNIYRTRVGEASGMNSQDMVPGQEKLYPYFNYNKYPLPRSGYESPNGNVIPKTVTVSPAAPLDTFDKSQRSKKTWIKGRLVEVTEGS